MSTRHPCRNRPRRTLADRIDACLEARAMSTLGRCPVCGSSDQRIEDIDGITHIHVAHASWYAAVDRRALEAIRREASRR